MKLRHRRKLIQIKQGILSRERDAIKRLWRKIELNSTYGKFNFLRGNSSALAYPLPTPDLARQVSVQDLMNAFNEIEKGA